MDPDGNAAQAGGKTGDQVLDTSFFFGDELWPADKLDFTKTAIKAKPEFNFVVSRYDLMKAGCLTSLKKFRSSENTC